MKVRRNPLCAKRLLDVVETIREGMLVHDSDLTVWFAHCSFGDTFTLTPEDPSRDKEGRQ
jgi:hypothetical protein